MNVYCRFVKKYYLFKIKIYKWESRMVWFNNSMNECRYWNEYLWVYDIINIYIILLMYYMVLLMMLNKVILKFN